MTATIKDVTMTIRLSPGLKDDLRKMAKDMEISLSDVARLAIQSYCRMHQTAPKEWMP